MLLHRMSYSISQSTANGNVAGTLSIRVGESKSNSNNTGCHIQKREAGPKRTLLIQTQRIPPIQKCSQLHLGKWSDQQEADEPGRS